MKRIWVYLLALAAFLLLPEGQGTDVGNLKPVEVLSIYIEDERIVVLTDTADSGTGKDLTDAIRDMKETTAGEIFLDTVAYVLVTEQTQELIPELSTLLRPATEVVQTVGTPDVAGAAAFLSVHKPEVTIKDCLIRELDLPLLITTGERCYLVQ